MSDEVVEKPKQALIDELLAQPLLARLATTNARTLQPHIVIVWYLWDGRHAWVSAFSTTRKVKDLTSNPRAALLVEPKQEGAKLQAVLLEGAVEVISEPGDFVASQAIKIYTHYLGAQGVLADEPQSWAVDPENRILKLTPGRILTW
jgi:nitroimidazol reductase NimA-like FMN-containing flavoprotein (pyridoxamine 5'-phosphate oxidase superfamily)